MAAVNSPSLAVGSQAEAAGSGSQAEATRPTDVEPAAPAAVTHLVLISHGILGYTFNTHSLCAAIEEEFHVHDPALERDPDRSFRRTLQDAVHKTQAKWLRPFTRVPPPGPPAMAVRVHACISNEGVKSTDGIEVAGARLSDEIRRIVAECNPRFVSLVGFSLGGLLMRYAAAELHDTGFFSGGDAGITGITGGNRPVALLYVGIASPHLGSLRTPSSTFNRLLWNPVGPSVGGRSMAQLFMEDGASDGGDRPAPGGARLFGRLATAWLRPGALAVPPPAAAPATPLLVRMATEPRFLEALACFKRRIVIANAVNDRLVPFSTACILPCNPLAPPRPPPARLGPRFPHVVAEPLPSADAVAPRSTWYAGHADLERGRLVAMLSGLDGVRGGWERRACWLPTGFLASAHNNLVNGWPLFTRAGTDCIAHLARTIAAAHFAAAAEA